MAIDRKTLAFGFLMGLAACALQAGTPRSMQLAARPLAFEENRGQTDPQVRFLSRGDGYNLFLTPAEAVLSLRTGDSARVLRLRWEGAASAPRISGEGPLPGESHYLVGNDPAKWRTGISSYQKVRYEGVYPGTDLVFYGRERQLEYDFVLAPGAGPERLRLSVLGADRMEIDPAGDLVLHLGEGEVRFEKPLSYQEIHGVRHEVASSWRRIEGDRIGFETAAYDRARPLVIDPVLVYSTFLGGSGIDAGYALAVDAAGNAYSAGYTDSPDFPPSGSPQAALTEGDAFVSKLDPNGALVYTVFLGGSRGDGAIGAATDPAGNVYVTGTTHSSDFPRVNPLPFPPLSAGAPDVFVTKLSPSGVIVYSTNLGGSGFESGGDIAVDSQGHAYVTGNTASSDFPRVNPLPILFEGGDAFVSKLSPSGSSLVYSTYLGGSDIDSGNAIDVDAAGSAFVTGSTESSDFPTVNAFQGSFGGVGDGFVARLHPSGSSLVWSTYLGGSGRDFTRGIAEEGGSVYVTGGTSSPDFPVMNALQPSLVIGFDAFVTKLGPAGSLVYSTYLGGRWSDVGYAIAVDALGRAHVTGYTESGDFPLKNPLRSICGATPAPFLFCSSDAFVTVLSPQGSALVFSTYLGGTNTNEFDFEAGWGIAVRPPDHIYVGGLTSSPDFPTVNAAQPVYGGGPLDAFVTRISLANRPPICSGAFASPATLWPPNGKLVPITIFGVTDPDGDPVTVTVTAIRQDEAPGGRGPDAAGIGTPVASVRSDRDGKGNGRVYHLTFSASDGQGGTCTGTVRLCVPHDQGRGRICGDGGPLFNSGG